MIYELIGTRPEVGRINPHLKSKVVFTGQHYEPNMNHLQEFGVKPDFTLTGNKFYDIYKELDKLYKEQPPTLTIVHGDTNTALAGAIVSSRYSIPVAHVEAGCRSGDLHAIEEQNRKMIGQLASYHFAPTENAFNNLKKENVYGFGEFTGDVMYDLFLKRDYGALPVSDHILLTIHRAENVDDPVKLNNIIEGVKEFPTIFPIHPRTKKRLKEFDIKLPATIKKCEPMPYAQLRCWEKSVRGIVTDSGGVQREAYWSQTPCVTIREHTEWPETIEQGWNTLAGTDTKKIKDAIHLMKDGMYGVVGFGDGQAHQKIALILKGFE